MATQFDIYITYSQLAVFSPRLDEPFNAWADEWARDRYSWRPQSVSFKTPLESGTCTVEVVEAENQTPKVIGSIEVPFDVPDGGKVEVASISDSCVMAFVLEKQHCATKTMGEIGCASRSSISRYIGRFL